VTKITTIRELEELDGRGFVAQIGNVEKEHKIFVEIHRGKKPLARPNHTISEYDSNGSSIKRILEYRIHKQREKRFSVDGPIISHWQANLMY
jgi:hypothetical protein